MNKQKSWHPGRLKRSIAIAGKPKSPERQAMLQELNRLLADSHASEQEKQELREAYLALK